MSRIDFLGYVSRVYVRQDRSDVFSSELTIAAEAGRIFDDISPTQPPPTSVVKYSPFPWSGDLLLHQKKTTTIEGLDIPFFVSFLECSYILLPLLLSHQRSPFSGYF